MTYIFALRPVTDERLLPQLSAALEQRAELSEREQTPKVWRAVDVPNVAARRAPDAGTRRRRMRYKTLGAMLLILGVLLVVPELFYTREVSTSLIVGAIALAWSLFTLIERDREAREREIPETPAQRLLHELGGLGRGGAHAVFTEDGLALETPDGERVTFSYDAMEYALETKDLLFLADAERVVTLQKNELSWGEWEDFREFLTEKVDVAVLAGRA